MERRHYAVAENHRQNIISSIQRARPGVPFESVSEEVFGDKAALSRILTEPYDPLLSEVATLNRALGIPILFMMRVYRTDRESEVFDVTGVRRLIKGRLREMNYTAGDLRNKINRYTTDPLDGNGRIVHLMTDDRYDERISLLYDISAALKLDTRSLMPSDLLEQNVAPSVRKAVPAPETPPAPEEPEEDVPRHVTTEASLVYDGGGQMTIGDMLGDIGFKLTDEPETETAEDEPETAEDEPETAENETETAENETETVEDETHGIDLSAFTFLDPTRHRVSRITVEFYPKSGMFKLPQVLQRMMNLRQGATLGIAYDTSSDRLLFDAEGHTHRLHNSRVTAAQLCSILGISPEEMQRGAHLTFTLDRAQSTARYFILNRERD